MTHHTREEATAALEDALRSVDQDNPVAASRKLARVAREYRPETRAEWDAFRFAAVKALHPYFEARDMDPAKATAWAVVDAHYGRTDGDGTPTPRSSSPPNQSGRPDSGSGSRSNLVRHRPDPSDRGQDGQDTRDEGAA